MSVRRVRQPLLTRPDGGLQFGLFPGQTWLLPDASAQDRRIAEADPTTTDLTERDELAQQLLTDLLAAGVLDDSEPDESDATAVPDSAHAALGGERDWLTASTGQRAAAGALARRSRAGVEIRGGHRWAGLLASLLTSAGVGRLRVIDDHPTTDADIYPGAISAKGDLRGPAATATAISAGSGTRALGPEGHRDLVVLADGCDLDPAAIDALMRAGTPHLVLAARAHHLQVGPLVVPGQTGCLTCWGHTRTDADPAWPSLAAQLAGRSCEAVGIPVVAIAAGLAAGLALQHLDAPDAVRSATITWYLDPTQPPVHRELAVHPLCGCSWARQPAA